MRARLGVATAVVLGAIWACGGGSGSGSVGTGNDAGTTADAGADAGSCPFGAPCPGQPPDAGPDAGPGQTADAGTDGGVSSVTFPNSPGWTFFTAANGAPQDVYDAAMDQGGNLWVAGGTEGLFLMKAGTTTFVKFGIADGLHPYGYLTGDMAKFKGVPDGSPADPNPSLSATPVISVAGGPAGTVFVGYQGKPGCEDNWNWDPTTSPAKWGDPAIYKSGDADRVTLNPDGKTINVTHYDIFSGPNVVGGEPGGREKLCTIYRIVYDAAKDELLFGANHGFAVGKASWQLNPTCGGEYSGAQVHPDCVGVYEHSHPAVNGCSPNSPAGSCNGVFLTDSYFGVAFDPVIHDAWFGGANRTTSYHLWSYGGGLGGYYDAEDDTEWTPGAACKHALNCGVADRFDIWPDNAGELDAAGNPREITVADRSLPGSTKMELDDNVSGIAATGQGVAWVSSFAHGLVQIDSLGHVLADATSKLMAVNVGSLAADPFDGSLWAGLQFGDGISRYDPAHNSVINYSIPTFGDAANFTIGSIQSTGSGAGRKMIVSFRAFPTRPWDKSAATWAFTKAGALGIYTGQ